MAKRREKNVAKTTDAAQRLRTALTKRTKGQLIDVLVLLTWNFFVWRADFMLRVL